MMCQDEEDVGIDIAAVAEGMMMMMMMDAQDVNRKARR